MKIAPLPINEQQRLAEIKKLDILDTDSEERYDRITRMAKKLFNVQVAVISVIDDHRQWYKSKQGIEISEVPRDITFCSYTLSSPEILLVEDATQDERFAENPFVISEPNVRFYAGYPLKVTPNVILGTLCIFDDKPRIMNAEEIQIFEDFGKIVESELSGHAKSITDQLTGLSNRRGLEKIGNYLLGHAVREQMPVTVLFIDINDFKKINDTFGHKEGDAALIKIAQLLKNSIRGMDLLARLGGDEFCILFINLTDENAEVLISRIQNNLNIINKTIDNYQIRISIGVETAIPTSTSTIEDFLNLSDHKMYKDKIISKSSKK